MYPTPSRHKQAPTGRTDHQLAAVALARGTAAVEDAMRTQRKQPEGRVWCDPLDPDTVALAARSGGQYVAVTKAPGHPTQAIAGLQPGSLAWVDAQLALWAATHEWKEISNV